ncbi:hypothetical protein [Williamsia sp. 1135]|uniref:hypothetical protein n=1 Tax=Williamsia sp. 1135 TaxID=1889262 RepID=UPI000A117E38|nr:hypothetical protein [Williamsia sp. 1135]ORM35486.1 hypothetical protein BFL43_09195 [Williamsia sp. 1135]
MTTRTPSSYADRAAHFRSSANQARAAGDLEVAARLDDFAQRAEQAHQARPWVRAEDVRYDVDDCCTECCEHFSDPHQPDCLYADLSYATA